ncbi:MAG TPA: pirin family protein [Gammaproteobacteria bacterium]|nr:pirin family protein [Gammaproteobacteria bacterium]
MSWHKYKEPECVDKSGPIALVIRPRPRDLGGFEVGRVLPARERRMIGPFIFLDHAGPAEFDPGAGADVRPHPHIGLATVTYLFEGAFLHRDSLGSEQLIEPGAVNWMTAGRGIVHSERTPQSARVHGSRLHGLQSWVALPKDKEESAPSFQHCERENLPEIVENGVSMRLVAGSAYGRTSPVVTLSPLFYLDAQMPRGSRFVLPAEYEDRALYALDAAVTVNGVACKADALAVLRSGVEVEIVAEEATRLILLGGAPLDGERFIWWNLVSSSREGIEAAKRDWAEGRFPKVPGDDKEFIPLPEGI